MRPYPAAARAASASRILVRARLSRAQTAWSTDDLVQHIGGRLRKDR
ncbi:hypothetical protein FHS39_002364 [Streptomyces olivoverticillatus]|uniref:Uncharacterized protein n=1 Tax=Streptomyces olivoverticillatus TaxID=66427 RepID=A0A7W7LN70_9ACTN|nr:hypothetical protein [Streptomyces olivoverticillatus]MBB4893333.1 hypothetical protein [Streptomyces olivoverticillatus]